MKEQSAAFVSGRFKGAAAGTVKPCPFCGGKYIVYEEYQHAAGTRWRIWCADCMAGIDPGYAQTQGQIQAMWNRRSSDRP